MESCSINQTTNLNCVVCGRDCGLKSKVVSIKDDIAQEDQELTLMGDHSAPPPSGVAFGRLPCTTTRGKKNAPIVPIGPNEACSGADFRDLAFGLRSLSLLCLKKFQTPAQTK